MAHVASAAAKQVASKATHPLVPGIAQLIHKTCKGRLKPSWTGEAQELLSTWGKIGVCMPYYLQFQKKTKKRDIKKVHVFMNEKAQARLGKFYLCCAFRLLPERVEAAGSDSQQLLRIASEVAQEHVEPFFEKCRKFVEDYDEGLHRRLDETTVWYEISDSMFWHHSFEVVAPDVYTNFQDLVLPPKAAWPNPGDMAKTEALVKKCEAVVLKDGPGRELAEDVYQRFLEASSVSVKERLRSALIDNGIVWGQINYRGKG